MAYGEVVATVSADADALKIMLTIAAIGNKRVVIALDSIILISFTYKWKLNFVKYIEIRTIINNKYANIY